MWIDTSIRYHVPWRASSALRYVFLEKCCYRDHLVIRIPRYGYMIGSIKTQIRFLVIAVILFRLFWLFVFHVLKAYTIYWRVEILQLSIQQTSSEISLAHWFNLRNSKWVPWTTNSNKSRNSFTSSGAKSKQLSPRLKRHDRKHNCGSGRNNPSSD